MTCQKVKICQKWKNWKRPKTPMKHIKLTNILCSVNFPVMCSVVKLTFLCYIPWWCFILFGMYCTQPATIPSSKLLVSDSLQGSNSHSSEAENIDTTYTYHCLHTHSHSHTHSPSHSWTSFCSSSYRSVQEVPVVMEYGGPLLQIPTIRLYLEQLPAVFIPNTNTTQSEHKDSKTYVNLTMWCSPCKE